MLIVSTLVTTAITAYELYRQYQLDVKDITDGFATIKTSMVPTLAEAVWVEDEIQIRTILRGLTGLRDIEHANVLVDGAARWSAGRPHSDRTLIHLVPIFRPYRGRDVQIGLLEIVASIDRVYARIWDTLLVMLASNAIKTVAVAAFMLFLFQYLVGWHLERLARHAEAIRVDPARAGALVLARPESGRWRPDVLDEVVAAVNHLRDEVASQYAMLQARVAQLTRAEDALRASEARLRQAQQLAKLGYAITCSDSAIENPSDTLATLIGMESDRVPKSVCEWMMLVHPEDRAKFRDNSIGAAMRGTRWDIEYRLRRGDGGWVDFRHVVEPLPEEADAAGRKRWFNMVQDITERKRAELEVATSAERLERLSQRLIAVQEEERARLARELHDELGQELAAVKIRLQSPTGAVAPGETVAIVDRALAQVRDIALQLHPPQLDDLGLVAALGSLIARSFGGASPKVEFAPPSGLLAVPADVALAAYRIAQEAIGNAVRHAGAASVRVALAIEDGALVLEVADDGAGFDARAAHERAQGGQSLGLVSMDERASLVGGTLAVRSAAGAGTTVTARLPL